MNKLNRKFCVAPMMGYTTPHARRLYRILSKHTFLFTEMIPTKTMIFSKKRDLIIENAENNPVALQVGGSDLNELDECTKIAKEYNYDEINLNLGCPSKAVQKGSFGACLMTNKVLVRNCLEKMLETKNISVSLKCRIGIGKEYNYDFFADFVGEIIKSGVNIIYVHARNAILDGLSPKNNRTIPQLNYNFVEKIKKEHPNIQFIINGGINSIEKAYSLSKIYDGVMLGRLIQNNPFELIKVDEIFYEKKTYHHYMIKIINNYFDYIQKKIDSDSIYRLVSPLLGIFFGLANSKKFKSKINLTMKENDIKMLKSIFLDFVKNEQTIIYK
tara:strand:- start:376 stop:1362 length:987 start_codon:yes stop_codon:yes gene_type:complete